MENSAYGEIKERSFSNPHPCPAAHPAPVSPALYYFREKHFRARQPLYSKRDLGWDAVFD